MLLKDECTQEVQALFLFKVLSSAALFTSSNFAMTNVLAHDVKELYCNTRAPFSVSVFSLSLQG